MIESINVIKLVSLVAAILWISAYPAWAQRTTTPSTVPGPLPVPPLLQPFPSYPMALIPTLTVGEEYNDNIFLDNSNRQSDFITSVTPGLAFSVNRPAYRFSAAYSFSALMYADHSRFNDAFAREDFALDGLYRAGRNVTFTLNDAYRRNENTNITTFEGVSTGRGTSRSNALTAGMNWEATRLTTLRLLAGYELERFNTHLANDANVYRIEADVDHKLGRRWTETVGYQVAYFDIDRVLGTTVHTVKVGAGYQFNPQLVARASVGPQVVVIDRSATVKPFAQAELVGGLRRAGSVSLGYEHSVTTSGGLASTVETDSVAATLLLNTWIRNLSLGATSRFTRLRSDDSTVNVRAVNLSVEAGYQFLPWFGALVGYHFFLQRSDGTGLQRSDGPRTADVDQNRLLFGVQFGAPLRLGARAN